MKEHITPEVGDVWLHSSGCKYVITMIDIQHLNACSRIWEDGWCDKFWYNDAFTEYNTYLGKSKANIDDLFKTENEE